VRILGTVDTVPGDIPAEHPPGTPYVPDYGDGWLDSDGDLHVWSSV
jgi:hypothetical protein